MAYIVCSGVRCTVRPALARWSLLGGCAASQIVDVDGNPVRSTRAAQYAVSTTVRPGVCTVCYSCCCRRGRFTDRWSGGVGTRRCSHGSSWQCRAWVGDATNDAHAGVRVVVDQMFVCPSTRCLVSLTWSISVNVLQLRHPSLFMPSPDERTFLRCAHYALYSHGANCVGLHVALCVSIAVAVCVAPVLLRCVFP